MSKVPFSMVDNRTIDNSGQIVTLERTMNGNIPDGLMYLFSGGNYTKQKVLDAIEYLINSGGGSFFIPENGNIKRTKIEVYKDFGVFHTRFIYYDFRYPSNFQARPYLDTEWEAGDMVVNQNLSVDSDSLVWVCISNGIPGLWVRNSNDGSVICMDIEVHGLSPSNKYTGYDYVYRYDLGLCTPNYYAYSHTVDWKYEYLVETGNGYVDFFFTHNFDNTIVVSLALFTTRIPAGGS